MKKKKKETDKLFFQLWNVKKIGTQNTIIVAPTKVITNLVSVTEWEDLVTLIGLLWSTPDTCPKANLNLDQ